MSSSSLQYRPDVDGLRAVAVMLVLIFHAFPEAVPGGFVGVDVFFVISGFLITGIITREIDQKRFSLAGFYARRIRRIFPALITVLAAALVLGWFWMLPSAYARLGSDTFASAGFAANIALWLQSGYFDVASAQKPLLHLWSLGIEEQFYLAWPLLLMLAARLRFGIFAVATVLAIASFGLNVVQIRSDPSATFYLPFTRAFELLVGAALVRSWSMIGQQRAASNVRAWTGLALIALAAAELNGRSAFPGWWAALPVAGTALMLSSPQSWLSRNVLSSGPAVRVGLVSYPLYLWHWPLLVFFAMIKFNPLTLLERGLVLLLSGLLAWATYRFIEMPLRFGKPGARKVRLLCTGMVIVGVAGAFVFREQGFASRLPDEIRGMAQVPTQSARWRVHECLLDLSHDGGFARDCVDADRRPLVLLWGDSTAGALVPGFRDAQRRRQFGLAQLTANSCIPALNLDIPGAPNCRAHNDRVLALAREIRPDIVVLHGTWEKNFENVAATVAALKAIGARVVVVGPVPVWRRGLPNEVLRYYMLHHALIPRRWNGGVSGGWVDAEMREKLVAAGAEFVSAWDALCNAEGCLTRTDDGAADISATDQVHLSEKGSDYLVDAIIDRILDQSAPVAK